VAPRCGATVGWAEWALPTSCSGKARRPATFLCGFDCRQPLGDCAAAAISGSASKAPAAAPVTAPALVAARKVAAYLIELRFPAEPLFQPWDVVDNAFFSAAGNLRRSEASALNKLPHFLWVGRTIPEEES